MIVLGVDPGIRGGLAIVEINADLVEFIRDAA